MKAFLYSKKFRDLAILTIGYAFYMGSAWIFSRVTGFGFEGILISIVLIKVLKMEIGSVQ